MTSLEDPSILYENEQSTLFIIDIPTSIAQAQRLNSAPIRSVSKKHLLSTPPLDSPYAGSCEPKTEVARARLLERIPLGERRFHDEVQLLLHGALQGIERGHPSGTRWCLPRHFSDEERPRTKRKAHNLDDSALKKQAHVLLSDLSTPNFSQSSWAAAKNQPPTILSSTCINEFESISELNGVVKNSSVQSAVLRIDAHNAGNEYTPSEYIIPPESQFVHCTIPISDPHFHSHLKFSSPIPGLLPTQKFHLILFDPPWPNRSVRRSGHYDTHPYDLLTQRLQDILHVHKYTPSQKPPVTASTSHPPAQICLAGIWITNSEKSRQTAYDSLSTAGFNIVEEWIWLKTTAKGEPISPIDGLWRKPYEILVIGRREIESGIPVSVSSCVSLEASGSRVPKRRVFAAVPDLHSRKPSLKGLFERVFFSQGDRVLRYTALEVFARNLTAGWCAAGNEVLKFNARECWVEG
jgi:N6-adenosine-specific RNA methylase IME4